MHLACRWCEMTILVVHDRLVYRDRYSWWHGVCVRLKYNKCNQMTVCDLQPRTGLLIQFMPTPIKYKSSCLWAIMCVFYMLRRWLRDSNGWTLCEHTHTHTYLIYNVSINLSFQGQVDKLVQTAGEIYVPTYRVGFYLPVLKTSVSACLYHVMGMYKLYTVQYIQSVNAMHPK